jgi:adenosylhomocysteine nucleosidase
MDYRDFLCSLQGKSALYLMATENEYGEQLKKFGVKPLIIGVGPVEAAMNTAVAFEYLKTHSALPQVAVSLGSAGSNKLTQGEVYQVSSVSYRDMDASAFGFPKGQTPFDPHPPTIALKYKFAHIPEASCSTGANVISGARYADIPEDMVEMETYAVMKVCLKFGVQLIGLRGISDGDKPVSGLDDWTKLLSNIDAKLAQALQAIVI